MSDQTLSGWGFSFEPLPEYNPDYQNENDFRSWVQQSEADFSDYIARETEAFQNHILAAASEWNMIVEETQREIEAELESQDDVIGSSAEMPAGYIRRRAGYYSLEEARAVVDEWGASGYGPLFWKEGFLWYVGLPERRRKPRRRSRRRR